METQFNINIAVQDGKVILTTDLNGLSELSLHTSREYSRYFAEAHAILAGPVSSEVVEDTQPPLPGL